MMHRLILASAAGMVLVAGCQTIQGPFKPKTPTQVVGPNLSIPEQQQRGRDRLAIPEDWQGDSQRLAPKTYTDRPSPAGR